MVVRDVTQRQSRDWGQGGGGGASRIRWSPDRESLRVAAAAAAAAVGTDGSRSQPKGRCRSTTQQQQLSSSWRLPATCQRRRMMAAVEAACRCSSSSWSLSRAETMQPKALPRDARPSSALLLLRHLVLDRVVRVRVHPHDPLYVVSKLDVSRRQALSGDESAPPLLLRSWCSSSFSPATTSFPHAPPPAPLLTRQERPFSCPHIVRPLLRLLLLLRLIDEASSVVEWSSQANIAARRRLPRQRMVGRLTSSGRHHC